MNWQRPIKMVFAVSGHTNSDGNKTKIYELARKEL